MLHFGPKLGKKQSWGISKMGVLKDVRLALTLVFPEMMILEKYWYFGERNHFLREANDGGNIRKLIGIVFLSIAPVFYSRGRSSQPKPDRNPPESGRFCTDFMKYPKFPKCRVRVEWSGDRRKTFLQYNIDLWLWNVDFRAIKSLRPTVLPREPGDGPPPPVHRSGPFIKGFAQIPL